ncbi:MAG TPA: tRNA epoxyqueuosine(34) reductase QueG [Bdellovibrionota bacterium]|nr:tRNA epoxyqueuosine(34) reductase QueG [Bdellovibrionota bacterium]
MKRSGAETLKEYGLSIGFDRIGITTADPPADFRRYLDWIERGGAGDLWYLTEPSRVEKRRDLQRVLPGVRTVIVGAISYAPQSNHQPTNAKFARYAWGLDYHKVVLEKLEQLAAWLSEQVDAPFRYRTYVDTGPILERSLAERAGIGWIGKNTCLMSEETGSYLYLGELLSTLDLPTDAPALNRCGTCTRCLDACPTQALEAPYQLRSDRCISYQTVENRNGEIPEPIAQRLNGWVAGCDICQEVCPWNHEPFPMRLEALRPLPHLRLSLQELCTLSEDDFHRHFDSTSFRRIGRSALARNAKAALRDCGSFAEMRSSGRRDCAPAR